MDPLFAPLAIVTSAERRRSMVHRTLESTKNLAQIYEQLDRQQKLVLQICAVKFIAAEFGGLARWIEDFIIPHLPRANSLTRNGTTKALNDLNRYGLLVRVYYSQIEVHPNIVDLAAQEAKRSGIFEIVANAIRSKPDSSAGYYVDYGSQRERQRRDLRIAFYEGNTAEFSRIRHVTKMPLVGDSDSAQLLQPFNRSLFVAIDRNLQIEYLTECLRYAILASNVDHDVLQMSREVVPSEALNHPSFCLAWIDALTACNDVAGLLEFDKALGSVFVEARGCAAFLQGEWDESLRLLGAVTVHGRSSKKRLCAPLHLAGVLHGVLLIRENSLKSIEELKLLKSRIAKAWDPAYAGFADVFGTARVRLDPTQQQASAADVPILTKPLPALFAGYLDYWLRREQAISPFIFPHINAAVIDGWQQLGFHWLVEQATFLLDQRNKSGIHKVLKNGNPLKSAAGVPDQAAEPSVAASALLSRLIEPVPEWQQALKSLKLLVESFDTSAGGNASDSSKPDQRLIWELNPEIFDAISLVPYVQRRSGSRGWTRGQRVALSRLHDRLTEGNPFDFATEEDEAIIRSIQRMTRTNSYGYADNFYEFDSQRAVDAIAGHPRIFLMGEREHPVEVVSASPILHVRREKNEIKVSFSPSPMDGKMQLVPDGPRRIVIYQFTPRQQQIQRVLMNLGKLPVASEGLVRELIAPLASIATVHSEIGGDGNGQCTTVDPDGTLRILLSPFYEGLKMEMFVSPLGEHGPLHRPGQGGEVVFAKIGGATLTTSRKLKEERKAASAFINACSTLQKKTGEFGKEIREYEYYFPQAAEALDMLLELQEQAQAFGASLRWPEGVPLEIAGRVDAKDMRITIRRDRDWFAASGDLVVDEKLSLSLMQLLDLMDNSGSRFVRLEDGRFLALSAELRRRMGDLRVLTDCKKDSLRFPAIRAAAFEEVMQGFKLKADKGWNDCQLRIREASSLMPRIPKAFQGELRDYQVDGYRWLCRLAHWGGGACLADDMGLGKTVQALAMLVERARLGPALIAAPMSVGFNWIQEAQRFAPTLRVQLFGAGDRDACLRDLGPRDVIVVSYGLLQGEAERFQAQEWSTIILDEAQAIKNTATKRSQAVMGLRADFRLAMSGTPLENHLGELWNLFQFINPGLLGSIEAFQNRFAIPIERDGDQDAKRQLKRLINPFILRRTKTQVLEQLPSRTEITLHVELTPEESAFYEALRRRAIEKLEGAEDNGPQHLRVLAELMRLRRACCHPRLVTEACHIVSSKLALFSATIDELLSNRHRVLVFSQFVDHLTILRDELDRKGIPYHYLDGGTSAKQRQASVEAFQAGEHDVFLISLKAGGLGLNLTGADFVLHMDPWWNPAVEDQASDRAHRLGQQRPVTIYRFVTKGTVEERIVELHRHKRDLADSLLEGTDVAGKISTDDLIELLREV
jgi:superfamily II DNA or RNA helicase